jgi:hypothetical protein
MPQVALEILKESSAFRYQPLRLRKIEFAPKLNLVCVKEYGHLYKGVPVLIKYTGWLTDFTRASIESNLYKHWQAYMEIDLRECINLGISLEDAEGISGIKIT